ncbi:MAG: NAD-dependent protein deacylase [Candidatus Lokiarchaeota archaeon]|nr:NAD-dependent protein deacylase [Candidatus Lokiarchaeota archaeon]
MDENKLQRAVEIIKNSNHIVVFSGAGISTESGIPDFRSEGGLWSKYDPSIYANYNYFLKDPKPFWTMHNELTEDLEDADPNKAHKAIAELEKMGKVKAIITQNVDMLHQRAGSGSYEDIPIYELHGAYRKLECIKCGKEYEFDEVETKVVDYPKCEECSGYIKPKVILFGESLPSSIIDAAINSLMKADCLIVVGSSLLVSPANFLPSLAKKNKAKVIFINKERTMMDDIADVFLKGSAGKIFEKIMNKLGRK